MSEVEEVAKEIELLITEHLDACPEDLHRLKNLMRDLFFGTVDSNGVFFDYETFSDPDDEDDEDEEEDFEGLMSGEDMM